VSVYNRVPLGIAKRKRRLGARLAAAVIKPASIPFPSYFYTTPGDESIVTSNKELTAALPFPILNC